MSFKLIHMNADLSGRPQLLSLFFVESRPETHPSYSGTGVRDDLTRSAWCKPATDDQEIIYEYMNAVGRVRLPASECGTQLPPFLLSQVSPTVIHSL
jgi:hypothetical protein